MEYQTPWLDSENDWSDKVSNRSKMELLGIDMDEEKIFAARPLYDPSVFSIGDRDALGEWMARHPKAEITPEQRLLLDKFDHWIERLDLGKKKDAPSGGGGRRLRDFS